MPVGTSSEIVYGESFFDTARRDAKRDVLRLRLRRAALGIATRCIFARLCSKKERGQTYWSAPFACCLQESNTSLFDENFFAVNNVDALLHLLQALTGEIVNVLAL